MVQLFQRGKKFLLSYTEFSRLEEEELQEMRELKAEAVLVSEEEDALNQLLGFFRRLQQLVDNIFRDLPVEQADMSLHQVLDDGTVFRARIIASVTSSLKDPTHDLAENLRELDRRLGKGYFSFEDVQQRLMTISNRAYRVRRLVEQIERKEIRFFPIVPRCGYHIIKKVVKMKEHEKKDLKRKDVILRGARDLMRLGQTSISNIQLGFELAFRTYHQIRDYAQGYYNQDPELNGAQDTIKYLREIFNKLLREIQNAIDDIKKALQDIDDYKHWLAHPIKESERVLHIQQRLDQKFKKEAESHR
jgi:hypothetical protein|tara:strand:- start:49 stop:960 length:912 start_codon:yes stop_codon:yes gene_type:complete